MLHLKKESDWEKMAKMVIDHENKIKKIMDLVERLIKLVENMNDEIISVAKDMREGKNG